MTQNLIENQFTLRSAILTLRSAIRFKCLLELETDPEWRFTLQREGPEFKVSIIDKLIRDIDRIPTDELSLGSVPTLLLSAYGIISEAFRSRKLQSMEEDHDLQIIRRMKRFLEADKARCELNPTLN